MKPSNDKKTDPGLGSTTLVDAPKTETPSTARLIPAERLTFDTDPRLALVSSTERDLVSGLGHATSPMGISIDTAPLDPPIADEPPSRLTYATDPRLALASAEERALVRGLGQAPEAPESALPRPSEFEAPARPGPRVAPLDPRELPRPIAAHAQRTNEPAQPRRPGATTVRLRLATWELGRFAAVMVVVGILLMVLIVWVLRDPKGAPTSQPVPSAMPTGPVVTTPPAPSPVVTSEAPLVHPTTSAPAIPPPTASAPATPTTKQPPAPGPHAAPKPSTTIAPDLQGTY